MVLIALSGMGYCNKATGNAVYEVYGNVYHFLFDERLRLLPREAWKDCPDIHLAIAFVPRICYNDATNLQGGIMQATRTEMVRARISPELKASAEGILSSLGMNPSQAIVLFYKQIELHNGLPFDLRIPPRPLHNMAAMTDDQLAAELQKGLDSARAGRCRSAAEARAEFKRRHAVGKRV